MGGLDFDCSDSGHYPYGASYSDPLYRVCAVPGSVAGETVTTGFQYVETALDFNTSQLSINVMAVFLFWIMYVAINCLAVEYLTWGAGDDVINYANIILLIPE